MKERMIYIEVFIKGNCYYDEGGKWYIICY